MQVTPEFLIAQSKVAAVVTDPRQPDNPIIACNDAFVQLTGYPHIEVIGRNCRFLRGEKTLPEHTALLREAITEQRPLMVELINYRKDGSLFRNAVMIAPLFDGNGDLTYFLGSQVAIDEGQIDRNERARALVEKLTPRQRQILAALAQGQLNKQIAFELDLTVRTVKMHRTAMMRALGAKTGSEAIRIAIEAGL